MVPREKAGARPAALLAPVEEAEKGWGCCTELGSGAVCWSELEPCVAFF